MSMRWFAWCVHAFTASGVVLGLLALLAVEQGDWQVVFGWLLLALVIDAVDGPIARLIRIKTVLPRFDGSTLDLLVDYLTFVIVPALVLCHSTILPESLRIAGAAAILVTALHHYCNLDIKTEDGYFVGFPAFWNIAVFYLYRFPVSPTAAAAIVAVLCVLTCVPIKVVHPLRVKKFRVFSFAFLALWLVVGGFALLRPDLNGNWLLVPNLVPLAYFTLISIRRTVAGVDVEHADHVAADPQNA
ncbi:phosphatidylcholine synthase [Duganella sp. HH101]|nr:phosphatidylcholine synthase [Duganella sp. HH101]